MKTSVVIVASVLLAGVALDVTAYSAYSHNGENEDQQWSSLPQRVRDQSSWDVSSNNEDTVNSGETENQYNSNNNKNRFGMQTTNEYAVEQINRHRNNKNYDTSNEKSSNEHQQHYNRQTYQQLASDGITRKIVDKIAAVQEIAVDHAAKKINYLNGDLEVKKSIIKMLGNHFVTFYNATIKNLEAGQLESFYINPGRDTVYVHYQFDRLRAEGSFKANDPTFKSGYFTIVLNKVNSTVTAGFEHSLQRPVLEPAKFQYADANIVSEDGTETQTFNDALEHRYLRELGNAVSNQVLLSTGRGMVAQLKNEVGKHVVIAQNGADIRAKLYDMKWTEDDVSMEMSNVGYRNFAATGHQADRLFNSVVFQRESENAYSMRYDFTFAGMEWSSPLTVESAGNKMNNRPFDFKTEKIDLRVTVFKSVDHQQQQQQNGGCAKVKADVDIVGFRYELEDESTVQSDLLFLIKNKLQRFMEHSMESHFKNAVEQAICGHNENNYNNNQKY